MKNSKLYAPKIKQLFRSLKQRHTNTNVVHYEEPIDALIYAIVSEYTDEQQAQVATKCFAEYFIDYNDLRVSRTEEIAEVFGDDKPGTCQMAEALVRVLKSVFDKYHCMSLGGLDKIGKRSIKQTLESLEGMSRFAVDYCMLFAFQGHAIPLTETMIQYLKDNKCIHPEADAEAIEGFLSKQISAKDDYDFYTFLRMESEKAASTKAMKRARATPKKKTVKKTAQKEDDKKT